VRVEPHQVTKESDPELFHILPWSHGTLGFLVAIEVLFFFFITLNRFGLQGYLAHKKHPPSLGPP